MVARGFVAGHKANMAQAVGQFSGGEGRSIVIGAGLMGRNHAMAIRHCGSHVVAIVDTHVAAARELAARFVGAHATANLGGAISNSGATIAHVCTPLESHLPLAEQLVAAGLHVLIEKPLAANVSDTRAVFRAFENANVLACPVHQYAFQRSVQAAAAALPSLGALRRIVFDIRSAGGGADDRRYDSIAAEIVPHPLSILQIMLPHCKLAELDWTMRRSAPGEWLANACWEGVLFSISISLGGRPTMFHTSLIGTEGSIEIDNFHDFALRMKGTVSRAAKINHPFVLGASILSNAAQNLARRALQGEGAYPGLRTLVGQFHDAARSDGQLSPPITPLQAIEVAEVRDMLVSLCER
jgi:predicted dehydrogenase